MPFRPHRRIGSVSGSSLGIRSGEVVEIGGMRISCNAFVGHEPMHERQPTHCDVKTTTGRFLCVRPDGFLSSGRSASNGQ